MNRDIIILREAITKVVQMLSQMSGLTVTQRGSQAYVKTDPRTLKPQLVNIPFIPDDASDDLIAAIQGFLDHEVAHILFTNWQAVKDAVAVGPSLAQLHNMVEDTFIEREMARKFPGCGHNLSVLHDFFIRKITTPALDAIEEGIKSGKIPAASRDELYFNALCVPLCRSWAGQHTFGDWLKDTGYDQNPLIKKLASMMPKDALARIPKIKDSFEALAIAKIIEGILHPPAPPAPKQNAKGQEQADEDGNADSEPSDKKDGKGKGEKPHKNESKNADGDEDCGDDEDAQNESGEGDGESGKTESDKGKKAGKSKKSKENKEDAEGTDEDDSDRDSGSEAAGEDDDGAGGSSAADEPEGEAEDASGDDAGDRPEDERGDGEGDDATAGASGDRGDDQDGAGEGDQPDSGAGDDGAEDGSDAADDDGSDGDGSDAPGSGDGEGDDESEAGDGGGAGDDGEGSDGSDEAGEDEGDLEGEGGEGDGDGAGDKSEGPSEGSSGQEGGDKKPGQRGKEEGRAEPEEGKGDLDVDDSQPPASAGDEDDDGAEAEHQPGIGVSFSKIEVKPYDFDSMVRQHITDEAIRQTRDADYSVYSTEFDIVGRHEMSPAYSDRQFTAMEDGVRHMVGVMQKEIERMMAQKNRVFNVGGQKRGKLNAPGLYRIVGNDPRVFKRKEEHQAKDTAVSLVVDNSGSMSGDKCRIAMSAAYALAATLERVNISHEVIGFTTDGHGKIGSGYNAYDIEREGQRLGIAYSRIIPMRLTLFKEFAERLTPPVRQRFADMAYNQPRMGGNVDGESIAFGMNRLMQRKEQRKVMLVLSDGFPAGGDPAAINSHLHRVVAEAKKAKIEIIGIGIQSTAVQTFYPKSMVLNRVEDLPKMVMGELKRILMAA